MNPNQPYQPYGQPQQPPPGQGPGSFRPFNPGQQGPPSSGGRPMGPPGTAGMPRGTPPQSGGIQQPMMNNGPPRPAFGGPPSAGGLNGPPSAPSPGGPPSFGGGPAPGPQFGGGAPPPGPQFRGPPGPQVGSGGPPPGPQFGSGAPPNSASGMAPPQRFAPGAPQVAGPPMSAQQPAVPRGPPSFSGGPPISGPPGMMAPPASAPGGFVPRGPPTGAPTGPPMGPPGSSGFQPRGPPTGPPTGPPIGPPTGQGPPTSQGLMNQFGQMNLGNGPPPMGANGPRPSFGMPPTNNPAMGMNGPPMGGQPPMGMGGNQPPRGYNAPPSGNYQQPNEMMDQNYNASGQLNQSPIPEELMASQCDPRFMRMSVGSIPHSQDHANKSNLMIGVVIRPLAPQDPGEELDVVNFGPTGVVRCRHCRTYVNPFVHWVDNGRRWRCNLCGVSNDVPSSYFCHLGANQQRQDREERPELHHGSIEIVAPSEYMMRPPQPPCYMFVIDVSASAVASGAVQIAAETIKSQLDHLPGAPRTRIGIITFDSTIHFYNLKSTLKTPQMMVIGDLEELFIPIPDELLVNLSDSRPVIETLLDTLPSIHQQARSAETALGPAIRVAFKLMSSIGGKMLVFQSSLPTTGPGALKNRDNPRLLGTDKEHSLFTPSDTFYRSNAIDFCRQQVSVDTFLFSSQYADVATIGSLSKFSGGQLYYYPAFTAERDGETFRKELAHCLTRETAWEAVMRVRCTKGMRLTNFYGNHFMRGPDLLALPTAHSDASFGIELGHSDALLSSSTISIQAALLYTNSGGERRIRVHNLCIPVSKLFAEVFRTADVDTLCNLMAKSALEMALKTGLDSARSRLQNQCADIVRAYRTSGAFQPKSAQNGGYQLSLPDSLQLLPLYVMSLLKNSTLRGGNDLNADERTFLQYELYNMSVTDSRVFIYPRLFALHNMPPEAGIELPQQEQHTNDKPVAGKTKIILPPVLNLSIERLACDGIFLLEDTLTLYLWVGRSVPSPLLTSLFGIPSMEGVDCKLVQLVAPHDELSQRVHRILNAIREDRVPFMNLVIMREGDPSEGRFFWKLVEDRASFNGGSYSYSEYLGQITRLSMGGATGGR